MSLRTLGLNSTVKNLFTRHTDITRTVSTVLDFRNEGSKDVESIMTRSDKELGGYSTVNFTIDPEENVGHFHGYLSLDLPKDNPEVTRSGYAMFRTKDQKESWISGDSYWDWSNFDSLVMRVKGDRRKYLLNIQANTPLVTDLFQHRLFLHHPGQWETVVIPLNDFVMTNWGVIQDGSDINKAEVKTFGVGLLDKQYGPYSLKIDWVKVMTGAEVLKETNKSRSQLIHEDHVNNGGIENDPIDPHKHALHEQQTAGSPLHTIKPEEPKGTLF
ncbi:complex I intermediate associated protein [Scheffersomyces amazonensis]|uniref:complex I intermediate associated protein n=1 Tax=Scheffersomyces amazonensis TaxID=1078765 RepID=UPI00315D25BF